MVANSGESEPWARAHLSKSLQRRSLDRGHGGVSSLMPGGDWGCRRPGLWAAAPPGPPQQQQPARQQLASLKPNTQAGKGRGRAGWAGRRTHSSVRRMSMSKVTPDQR